MVIQDSNIYLCVDPELIQEIKLYVNGEDGGRNNESHRDVENLGGEKRKFTVAVKFGPISSQIRSTEVAGGRREGNGRRFIPNNELNIKTIELRIKSECLLTHEVNCCVNDCLRAVERL